MIRIPLLTALMATSLMFCSASPPGRPALGATTAGTLTVRKAGSTTAPQEIVGALPAGASSLVGKPIKGKLQIQQLKGDVLQVPGASAMGGDYLLQNEHISVVVNAPQHVNGNAISGGYIIDGFMNDRPVDRIAQLHLYLNNKYPRMARFTEASIAEDGSTTDVVALVVTGKDSEDPSIDITTTYSLRAGSKRVEIYTSLMPGRSDLIDFPVGDAFAWGPTQQFIPGPGFEAKGGSFKAPWIGGGGGGVAYGYFSSTVEEVFGPIGSTWADPIVTTATVTAGESFQFHRSFVVGHDLAEVAAVVYKSQGKTTYPAFGTVVEAESGRPADGVRITARTQHEILAQAETREGRFEFQLPAGQYSLRAADVVRSVLSGDATVTLPMNGSAGLSFSVASPAVLNVQIHDSETEEPLPSRILLIGRDGTPDPDLGPAHETRTRNMVYIPYGMDRLAVPDGKYDLVVTRGLEYDLTTYPVVLERNRETAVQVALRRAVAPEGMFSADFHLHMKNSFDSAVSLEDRVISCVGEGLDLIVATDHNFITDLAPVVEKLQLTRWVKSIVGNEITTRKHMFGHFNAFPLTVDTNEPGNGASLFEGTIAANLFADAHAAPGEQVVQVNHPRAGDIGYFDRVQLSHDDATTTHLNWSDRFTAIEVFNGKRIDHVSEVLQDWFNLLNLGYTFTATGNSDSHKVYDAEPGYPRNYVRVQSLGADAQLTPAPRRLPRIPDLVAAVNVGHAVLVTNGPIVTFRTINGTDIGSSQTLTDRPVEFTVRVEGANFVKPNQLQLFANGKVVLTQQIPETSENLKWAGTVRHEPVVDTWYVVQVQGTQSMEPIMTPFKEGTLQLPPTPMAFTNPIWIDRDGDGQFTAINRSKYPLMQKDRSAEAVRKIDELTTQSQQRNLFSRRKRPPAGES